MATKAEQFRYWEERSGPKKARRRRVWVGSRRGGTGLTAHRGPTKRLWKNASYPLEESQERKYNRVSSRSSANAMKPNHPLREAKRGDVMRDAMKAKLRAGRRRR